MCLRGFERRELLLYWDMATDDLKEFVHERFRRTDEKLDKVIDYLIGLRDRVGRVEVNTAQIQVTLAEHSSRMDRIESRLERIEKRLDLVEA
jgi:archaellum component FlaC